MVNKVVLLVCVFLITISNATAKDLALYNMKTAKEIHDYLQDRWVEVLCDEEATQYLMNFNPQSNPRDKEAYISILMHLGGPEAVKALLPYVRDKDVKVLAVSGICQSTIDDSYLRDIGGMLSMSLMRDRTIYYDAVAGLRPEDAYSIMIKGFENAHTEEEKEFISMSLSGLGASRAVPHIVNFSQSTDD